MNRILSVTGLLLLCSCMAQADSLTLFVPAADQTLPVSTLGIVDETLDASVVGNYTVALVVTSGPDSGETISSNAFICTTVPCGFGTGGFTITNDGTAGTDTISGSWIGPDGGGSAVSSVTITWTGGTAPAPEPASVLLVAAGFLSLCVLRLFR